MDDLINRDHAAQAIEAYLCNQCDHDTDCDPECIACPHLDGAKILKSVPAINHWIPCSERLPEIFESVLIIYLDLEGNKHITMAYMDDEENAFDWRSDWNGDVIDAKVTHWMPPPFTPPEGDNVE